MRDLAWAAGLFEGEGSFHLTKLGNSPQVQIRMCDLDVLEKFQRIIGFGKIHEHKMKNPKHRTQFNWRVTGWQNFEKIVALIGPFMGERRAAKIAEIEAHRPSLPRRTMQNA